MQCKPLPFAIRNTSLRTLLVPPGQRFIQKRKVFNNSEPNCAIEYNLQIGNVTDNVLRVELLLFSQIAKEPAFNILRTQEQLGEYL